MGAVQNSLLFTMGRKRERVWRGWDGISVLKGNGLVREIAKECEGM